MINDISKTNANELNTLISDINTQISEIMISLSNYKNLTEYYSFLNNYYKTQFDLLTYHQNKMSVIDISDNHSEFINNTKIVKDSKYNIFYSENTIINNYDDTDKNTFGEISKILVDTLELDLKMSMQNNIVFIQYKPTDDMMNFTSVKMQIKISFSEYLTNAFFFNITPYIKYKVNVANTVYNNSNIITFEEKNISNITIDVEIPKEYMTESDGIYYSNFIFSDISILNIKTPESIILYNSVKKINKLSYIEKIILNKNYPYLLQLDNTTNNIDIVSTMDDLINENFNIISVPAQYPIANQDNLYSRIVLKNKTKIPMVLSTIVFQFS